MSISTAREAATAAGFGYRPAVAADLMAPDPELSAAADDQPAATAVELSRTGGGLFGKPRS